MTILYFIIALGLLIFIHELGHFIVAKRSGVGVQVFSLGFGPRLIAFHRGETRYQISLLPLGGYVKLTGESPDSEDADDPKSFVRKRVPTRLGIVVAGPMMNLWLALAMMPLVFWLGRPIPAYLEQPPVIQGVGKATPAAAAGLKRGDRIRAIDGRPTERWDDVLQTILIHPEATLVLTLERDGEVLEREVTVAVRDKERSGFLGIEPSYLAAEAPVIDVLQKGGAAERAGLQPGDRVEAMSGKEVLTWSQMTDLINEGKGAPRELTVKRGRGTIRVTVVPRWDRKLERYRIGVQKDPEALRGEIIYRQYPLLAAILEGSRENLKLAGLTFQVLSRLVTLQLSYRSLGGPIRIAQAAGSAARSGVADFLYFMAFLSLQLGILNLLPIPVLDGGHAFFMFFEVIRRKPLSDKIQGIVTQAGLCLLLFLMVMVTINDVDMVWGLSELINKIRAIF